MKPQSSQKTGEAMGMERIFFLWPVFFHKYLSSVFLQWGSNHLRSGTLLASNFLSCPHPQLWVVIKERFSFWLSSAPFFWQRSRIHQSSGADFTLSKTTHDICANKWLPIAFPYYSIKLTQDACFYKNKTNKKIWQHSIMSSISSC